MAKHTLSHNLFAHGPMTGNPLEIAASLAKPEPSEDEPFTYDGNDNFSVDISNEFWMDGIIALRLCQPIIRNDSRWLEARMRETGFEDEREGDTWCQMMDMLEKWKELLQDAAKNMNVSYLRLLGMAGQVLNVPWPKSE